MKHFFIFILFNLVFLHPVFAEINSSPEPLIQNKLELAVWKIITPEAEGTGVFVGESFFAVHFDMMLGLLSDADFLQSIILSHEENSISPPVIEGIHSISPSDNVLILKTKEKVKDYVNLAQNVSEPQGQLFVSGYLPGDSEITRKEGKGIFYEDKQIYMFPYNLHSYHNVMKGGLVWDEQGRILGMAFKSRSNVLVATKQSRLNKALNEGLNCSNSNPVDCVAKALQELSALADEGLPEAKYNLAEIFIRDTVVFNFVLTDRDRKAIYQHYEQAAEQGSILAKIALPPLLNMGIGTERNPKKAFDILNQLKEQGYFPAEADLARMYKHGNGVEQNFKKALEHYARAANQGHASARHSEADMHSQGLGTKQDFHKARKLYEQNMALGYHPSQHYLAFIHANGEGTVQDYSKALKLHEQIMDDYFPSKIQVAKMYRKGMGTKQNPGKAFELYKEMAEQNFANAQFILGQMYITGEGAEANEELGREWINRAAEQGHPEAMEFMEALEEPKTIPT